MKSETQVRTYQRAECAVFSKTKEGFGGLSNMAGGFPLRVNGMRILTSEALYQACRFPHLPNVQRLIIQQHSPMTAKMKSKPYRGDSRPDWDRVRVKVMRWCLRVKLTQNWRAFSELLLETGERPIVEESRKDDFWGAKPIDELTLVGMNVLGRLLMELREAVKAESRDSFLQVEPIAIPDFLLGEGPIGTVTAQGEEVAATPAQPVQPPSRGYVGSRELAQPSLFDASVVKEAVPPAYLYPDVSAKVVRIADLKPYPEYKESGLPWLGQVPVHWGARRTKVIFRERVEKDFPDESLLAATQSKGVVRKEDYGTRTVTAQKDFHLLKLVEVGDFVISLRSFQGGIEVAHYRGIISPAYTVLEPRSKASSGYFRYFFKSPGFISSLTLFVTGIREGQNIDYERLSRAFMPLPPAEEQAAIVRFLDYATPQLDKAIRAKRKVIALLNEQKQAIIHRAVTRGLDPVVPLKPSDIPWLGDIPQHWEVRRVKQATRILRGRFTHRPRNDSSLYDGKYPFIQTGIVARAAKFITTYSQTLNEKGLAVSKMFQGGTLVMTIAANIGEVAVLTFDACFPDSIVGFVPSKDVDRDYLYLVFRCMKSEFMREAPVNTQGNLNVERIGAMGIPFPSRSEQEQIAKHVETETSSFDSTISRLEREIELLREYRTRLVADVVTGKLDVLEAAARLPELEPESGAELDTTETDEIEEDRTEVDA